MKEHQTPLDVSARSAKHFRSKKSNKIGKKSLNAAFTSASEDFTDLSPLSEMTNENHNEDVIIAKKSLNTASTSVSEDCEDLSPGSEISNENRGDVTTYYLLEEPSSVTVLPSDIAPSKNISDTNEISSTISFGVSDLEDFSFASVETEIALNFLHNADPQYRKVMDEIIENVMSYINSNTVQEETNRSAQVLSTKNLLLFFGVFIWFIGVVVVLFFTSDDAYHGPLPT